MFGIIQTTQPAYTNYVLSSYPNTYLICNGIVDQYTTQLANTGPTFLTGDSITMTYNNKTRTLTWMKNDDSKQSISTVIPSHVDMSNYVFAVSILGNGDTISIK